MLVFVFENEKIEKIFVWFVTNEQHSFMIMHKSIDSPVLIVKPDQEEEKPNGPVINIGLY